MAKEIFPPLTMEFFEKVCMLIGGRTSGAKIVLDAQGILEDPDQATVVRDGSAHTAGLDVMIGTQLRGRASPVNYQYDVLPTDIRQTLLPPDSTPVTMAMLIMHELGHISIHPAGTSPYLAQMRSLLMPKVMQGRVMNVLSDLMLNHNVMHGTNLSNADDDTRILIRKTALLGLASLYLAPACGNTGEHKRLREAGTLPDNRYAPTQPCTATSDPNPDGIVVPCGQAGTTHSIGCFDDHYVRFDQPDDVDNFSVPGPETPDWEVEMGHGRSPQVYPTLTQVSNIPGSSRYGKAAFRPSDRCNPAYRSSIEFHNCHDCGNVWYASDSVYQNVSDGGFDDAKPLYASGERCPGRIPWQSNCDSSNISSWSLAADTEFTITGTRTYDNRPASEDGLMGLEPIWCVEMDSTTPGLTLVRGVGNPVARIGHGYVNHLCADCGSTLSSLYGVGMFGAWRDWSATAGIRPEYLARVQWHPRNNDDRVAGQVYFQQLQMQQWAAIYATMSDVFPDIRLLNLSGNRLNGSRAADHWIKLVGIDAARNNRGF